MPDAAGAAPLATAGLALATGRRWSVGALRAAWAVGLLGAASLVVGTVWDLVG